MKRGVMAMCLLVGAAAAFAGMENAEGEWKANVDLTATPSK